MKVYNGVRTPDGCSVTVADEAGVRDLDIRHDVRLHSEGFEWGYVGSGPAQLSLALLCDALGDVERARELYQEFKRRVFANISQDEWTLTEDKINEIVACLEAGCHVT